jgi:hypothetical protein
MRLGAFGLGAGLLLLTFTSVGCKSSKTTPTNVLPAGTGICQDTCAKTCSADSDCDTSTGELCCDYGTAGKACSQAAQCPIMCTDDSKCDPTKGQACERVDLSLPGMYCTTPADAIQLCAVDTDCATGDVCCGIYDQPFCLPPSECPKTCGTSNDCNTANGEICCTSVSTVEPAITASGLCLNPTYSPCPKPCSQSTDCNTANGEICCDGICSTTCQKTCKESSDCNQQICCKSALVNIPPATQIFTTGPHCAGTPAYTCLECGELGECGGTYCPGCTSSTTTTGTCLGTREYTCATCGELGCSATYCPGCTSSTTTTGTCIGTREYTCATFSTSYMTDCIETAGCSWNATNSTCSGTITPCASITSETVCDEQLDCSGWSTGTTNCTGTLTPCGSITSETVCDDQLDCSGWSTGTTNCTGTPTDCSQLSPTTCSSQPGCNLVTTN